MNRMNKNEHVSKTSEMICSVQKLVEIVPGSSLSKFQATRMHITVGRESISSSRVSGIQIGTVLGTVILGMYTRILRCKNGFT